MLFVYYCGLSRDIVVSLSISDACICKPNVSL